MLGGAAFAGQVALVTGAASGIGEACSRRLAASGASVVLADIDGAGLERVAKAIVGGGGSAEYVPTDVTDHDAVQAMVAYALSTFGGLDVAVNNAGVGGESNPVASLSPQGWLDVLDIDLNGVFYSMRAELAVMAQRGTGAIVNMSSVLGGLGFANFSGYTAAKHAIIGLTRTAALEYGRLGIRVNSVGPGFIATPSHAEGFDVERSADLAQRHALNRLGTSDEVAALVCFLASPDASFITGSHHLVDGGYSAA